MIYHLEVKLPRGKRKPIEGEFEGATCDTIESIQGIMFCAYDDYAEIYGSQVTIYAVDEDGKIVSWISGD